MTHIWVGNLTIIGSDNGLWPGLRQAWTDAGILLIEPLGTNFSEILIGIQIFSFKKMRWKTAAILSRPQCVNIIDMWCGRRGICAHFMSIITGYMRTVSTNGEHVYLYDVFSHWLGPFPGDPIHQTRDGAWFQRYIYRLFRLLMKRAVAFHYKKDQFLYISPAISWPYHNFSYQNTVYINQ